MKSLFNAKCIVVALMALPFLLSSCTVNDKGEFELTWLFWVILIAFIVMIIYQQIKIHKEAKERGITPLQLMEERRKNNERDLMALGLDVQYLGGYPLWPNPCKVNFSIKDSNIILKKRTEELIISKEMILEISNEKSAHRSVGKTAAGAIIGGALSGGLGLIVGGALGARRNDTSEIFIIYDYNGNELTLHLMPGNNTDKVYAWINSVYAESTTAK